MPTSHTESKVLERGKAPRMARAVGCMGPLVATGSVPLFDRHGIDYALSLSVSTEDPQEARVIADYCTKAINAAGLALDSLRYALTKLDSVAFLSTEGDTELVKQNLRATIAALEASP